MYVRAGGRAGGRVCMHAFMCVCVRACVYTYARACVCTCVCARVRVRVRDLAYKNNEPLKIETALIGSCKMKGRPVHILQDGLEQERLEA